MEPRSNPYFKPLYSGHITARNSLLSRLSFLSLIEKIFKRKAPLPLNSWHLIKKIFLSHTFLKKITWHISFIHFCTVSARSLSIFNKLGKSTTTWLPFMDREINTYLFWRDFFFSREILECNDEREHWLKKKVIVFI